MLEQDQLESTIKMLALAAAQIEATMIEAGSSVSELSASFTDIAEKFHHLDGHQNDTVVEVKREDFQDLREKLNKAIIAMQFYDRMTQRLHHVNSGLTETATLLERPESISPEDWHKLQSAIKDNYTMESERAMFEQIVAGTSLKEALTSFKQSKNNETPSEEDDVELF